jgi:uncharacterized lipoprotein YbaY
VHLGSMVRIKRGLFGALCIAALVLGSGCQSKPEPFLRGPVVEFSGTIASDEALELPASASARVSLVETGGAAGEPARTLATAQILARGRQFPLPFRMTVEERLLRSDRSYSLAAAVAVGGQLRYVAMPPMPIDPKGNRAGIVVKVTVPTGARR